jgi:hypothetical protein
MRSVTIHLHRERHSATDAYRSCRGNRTGTAGAEPGCRGHACSAEGQRRWVRCTAAGQTCAPDLLLQPLLLWNPLTDGQRPHGPSIQELGQDSSVRPQGVSNISTTQSNTPYFTGA